MKLLFALILWVLAFTPGCQSMDTALSTRGVITTNVSKIDNTRIVSMTPVLSKHGLSDIQAEFGLYWDSAKGEKALLVVELDGAVSFDPAKPIEIKIDGELVNLPSANSRDYGDVETEYNSVVGYENKSRKYYTIKKAQILQIANAEHAFYRIWFLKNTYSEGEITYQYQDYQSYVPASFRKFYSQVWGSGG